MHAWLQNAQEKTPAGTFAVALGVPITKQLDVDHLQ